MNKYTEELQQELIETDAYPFFEIEVWDKTGEAEWILGDIYFKGNSIIVERDAVNSSEVKSKFIPSTRMVVDPYFSLDEHLIALHEEVQSDILEGDLYTLDCNKDKKELI